MEIRKLFIDGEWVDSQSDAYIEIENPATHEIIAKVPRGNEKDVDRAVEAARKAFETWQYTPLETRLDLMGKVVEGLKSRRQELIETITKELGSPYKVSAEVHTDPFLLEASHYVKVASEFTYEQRRQTSVVRREPVGVVGGLTPWNFPLEQIEKKVVPALLAGNCVVLKPSQFTPLTAYILTEEIEKAGYPHGVFNLVTGRGGEVGNALASHKDVDMISFTGSTDAGREVARKALVNIKKLALELGGKSAAILLKGGDWEGGIRTVLDTVVPNAGQTCNALTRLLVPEDELSRAEAIILNELKDYTYGPSDDWTVSQGPLSSRKQFDRVRKYIELGLEEGGTDDCRNNPGRQWQLLCGTGRIQRREARYADCPGGNLWTGTCGIAVPDGGRGGGNRQRQHIRACRSGVWNRGRGKQGSPPDEDRNGLCQRRTVGRGIPVWRI